jgi:hypothetical protein
VSPDPAAGEFARCRARLEEAVAGSCEPGAEWPDAVAAGIQAALEFAAADPAAARVLTVGAIAREQGQEPHFAAMVDHLAGLLGAGAPPPNPRLPGAPGVITRIARQVNLEIEAGRVGEMIEVAPDLTFLALLPYLGFSEARRRAQPTATA